MRFPQKVTLLICGCVIVLVGLCLIQYRLVVNTYRLEKAAYFRQVKQQLTTDTQMLTDSLNHHVMRDLLDTLQYQLKNGLHPNVKVFSRHINQKTVRYQHLINEALLKNPLLKNVGYSLLFTEILLSHKEHTDTLVQARSRPLILTGNGNGKFLISEGKQLFGFGLKTNTLGTTPDNYRLEVRNAERIAANDWQQTVFRKMSSTLAGSTILITAVVVLFFLIFKALLQQKKIAEVTTDFANNMTHELKTPLSTAGLIVKSLRTPDAKLDEGWSDELLDQLDRQHGKIRQLVDKILTSALENPLGVAQMRTFHIKDILDEITMVTAGANRELLVRGQTELVLHTDPELVSAILANLVDNALKYTAADSILLLEIHINKEQTVTISLQDEGPGIDQKYHRYLFQKFFRVPRPDTGQIKGLGLGLYLCRLQARQLNGELTYLQSASGGSIFKLMIPYD